MATYNGDSNNNSVTSGAAAEPVSITASMAKDTLTTTVPGSKRRSLRERIRGRVQCDGHG